jgi:hypothetical protein
MEVFKPKETKATVEESKNQDKKEDQKQVEAKD